MKGETVKCPACGQLYDHGNGELCYAEVNGHQRWCPDCIAVWRDENWHAKVKFSIFKGFVLYKPHKREKAINW